MMKNFDREDSFEIFSQADNELALQGDQVATEHVTKEFWIFF